jgi:hypothetical protein
MAGLLGTALMRSAAFGAWMRRLSIAARSNDGGAAAEIAYERFRSPLRTGANSFTDGIVNGHVRQPSEGAEMATKKSESTGSKAAAAAAKVLKDPKASKDAKTAAASTLTQSKSMEATSAKAAAAASKVMRDPKASKEAKTAAASALTQRPGKK